MTITSLIGKILPDLSIKGSILQDLRNFVLSQLTRNTNLWCRVDGKAELSLLAKVD